MLYVTDSIPENNQRAQGIDNMEIISLSGDIQKIMFAS